MCDTTRKLIIRYTGERSCYCTIILLARRISMISMRRPRFKSEQSHDWCTVNLDANEAFPACCAPGSRRIFLSYVPSWSHPPREKELGTYLEMGFYIGITGFVCKEKHGKTLREMVSSISHTFSYVHGCSVQIWVP